MRWPKQKPIRNVPSLDKYTGINQMRHDGFHDRQDRQDALLKKEQQKRCNISGIKPRLVGRTLFVKLPAELQRVIEGGCQCRHCKAAAPGKVPMWDTLAIAANAEGHTWTVHFPDLES